MNSSTPVFGAPSKLIFFFFFCVPQLYLWGFTILDGLFAYVTGFAFFFFFCLFVVAVVVCCFLNLSSKLMRKDNYTGGNN